MARQGELDRVFVVTRREGNTPPLIEQLYGAPHLVPAPLRSWEDEVQAWCGAYRAMSPASTSSRRASKRAVFLFDLTAERVVLAYAISAPPLQKRDAARIRRFPDGNVGIRVELGERAFLADRGHFLGHASGGVLDIILFPHRRDLNRSWSKEGRVFRAMEKYVAENPGAFFFHGPIYDDVTWIPAHLEYGDLDKQLIWHRATFANK